MAKRKIKNIDQIKEALLSNTDYIKKPEPEEKEEPVKEATPKESQQELIAPDVLFKLETLAKFENVSTEEMVNKALNHFLRIKKFQLEQAMNKRMAEGDQ